MTNFEYLANKANIKELAMRLIQFKQEESIDYDWDEEPYVSGMDSWYQTSDGREFGFPEVDDNSFDEAVEHEIEWLNAERQDG